MEIIFKSADNPNNDEYIEYRISPSSMTLQATYIHRYDEGREHGGESSWTEERTYPADWPILVSSYYNDGYGNYERLNSSLEEFIIKDNGTIIYSGTKKPQDGLISNGYKFNVK